MTRTHLLLALAIAAAPPACVVSGTGTVGVTATTPIVYKEPPPPQEERVVERPHYIWVRGRWDLRDDRWVWMDGHWERERPGRTWQEGRWERRGNQWHWMEGSWIVGGADGDDAPGGVTVTDTRQGPSESGGAPGGVVVSGGMYPTQAPPPARVESYGAPRAGHLWVSGRWDWRNGQWAWIDGHWERQRPRERWVPGRWELQGNYYVWIDGRWDAGGPVVRDHR